MVAARDTFVVSGLNHAKHEIILQAVDTTLQVQSTLEIRSHGRLVSQGRHIHDMKTLPRNNSYVAASTDANDVYLLKCLDHQLTMLGHFSVENLSTLG